VREAPAHLSRPPGRNSGFSSIRAVDVAIARVVEMHHLLVAVTLL
jgi:hypothetical protein